MSKILQALEKAQRDGEGELVRPEPTEAGPSMTVAPEINAAASTGAGPEPPASTAVTHGDGAIRSTRERFAPATRTATGPEDLTGVDPQVECLHRPLSVVAEAYRGLRSRLERQLTDQVSRVIAVTSAVKGEGKSVTAANLAIALAQDEGKRVLLVDADMRRPRVHTLLGLAPAPGLGDLLVGRTGFSAAVQRLSGVDLDVVCVGDLDGHPGELMASAALAETLGQLRRSYDFILLDTPPVHPISDVAFLSEVIDGYLVVVQARKTPKETLKQLGEHIPAEKVLGAVLNRSEVLPGKYGYGKEGYGYGGY